jgi:hypothetical protein
MGVELHKSLGDLCELVHVSIQFVLILSEATLFLSFNLKEFLFES